MSSARLILADLDQFRQIDDQQGHLAGDHANVMFADATLYRAKAAGRHRSVHQIPDVA